MAVPTTNVGMDSIQTEFGGTNPISMDEYYAGGANVPPGTQSPVDPSPVPSSGAITIGEFRGCTKVVFPINGSSANVNASNSPAFTTNCFINFNTSTGAITHGGGGTGGGTTITYFGPSTWITGGTPTDYSIIVTSIDSSGTNGQPYSPTTTGGNNSWSGSCGPGHSNTAIWSCNITRNSDSVVVATFSVSVNMDNT